MLDHQEQASVDGNDSAPIQIFFHNVHRNTLSFLLVLTALP